MRGWYARKSPYASCGTWSSRAASERQVRTIPAFYYTKKADAILIFHFFKKKTQETPLQEIETAKSRLKEML